MILREALIRVNNQYFNFTDLPDIIQSKGQQKLQRKSIIFGTYDARKNIIKIHPILLTSQEFVLDFVVYHEMLHYQDRHLLLKRRKGDPVHTKDFMLREKLFLQYSEAQKILKDILYNNMNVNSEKEQLKNTKISQSTTKRQRLTGEALEVALSESLNTLDRVLAKYNLNETTKGAKRGSKKRNEQNELDHHD